MEWWNLKLIDGDLRGFHQCPSENFWRLEPDGWEDLTFIFDAFYTPIPELTYCVFCKDRPPKELISIFKMYRKLCSGSSESLSI